MDGPCTSKPGKILILKPSSLGDVLHALPVLRLLKKQFPESQIHWWISQSFAPLLEGDRDIAMLHLFKRNEFNSIRGWIHLFQTARRLRNEQFDWVLDLQGLARSAIMAWLARGKLTVGMNTRREGASAVCDLLVDRAPDEHAVDWYLGALRTLKIPQACEFDWLPARPDWASQFKLKWPANGGKWVAIAPGARWDTKRWPPDYFKRAIELLLKKDAHLSVAIFGDKSDAPIGAALASVNPQRCLDLTQRTSLPELVEWIRHSEILLTNDTGTMHIAAALKKPVVALFGATNPNKTGPYGQSSQVVKVALPCSPCMKRVCKNVRQLECLRLITPEQVAETVWRRMAAV